MSVLFAPPISFPARYRPLTGPAKASFDDVASRLLRYLLIALAHGLAIAGLLSNTTPSKVRPETTLAVDWLIETPVVSPLHSPRPPLPQQVTQPVPRQAPPPIQPAARPPVAAPLPSSSEAARPVPTASTSEAVAAPTPPATTPPATSLNPAPSQAAPPEVLPPRYDADYLHNPAPTYPPLSRRLGEEGKVTLRVEVSADGQARQVEVARSSGSPRLDAAAIEAVRQWRFQPARLGDRPLAGWVQIPINFRLSN